MGGACGKGTPLLFIIIMDVLFAMFKTAERATVIADTRSLGINHRVSLYADDVVVFAKPEVGEVDTVKAILTFFGDASGLVVNYSKSSATPIRCSDDLIAEVSPALSCQVLSLPFSHLGLPLSVKKLRKVML
jgi:hypothetical protein